MKIHSYRASACLFLIFSLAWLSIPARGPDADSVKAGLLDGPEFNRPPLRFEINEGQTDSQVRFTARGGDGISFLTSEGVVFQITRAVAKLDLEPGRKNVAIDPEAASFESSFVQLKTAGANPNPRVIGMERLPGVTNYFIGNDKRTWRTNVAGYAKVKYEGVYPGIDLVYYDNGEGALEYDFVVAPGADPNQIALSIEGAEDVELGASGELVITAATGKIHQPAPRIYQDIEGKRQEVAGGYRMLRKENSTSNREETRKVAFELAAYDLTRPLVIDPEVVYATYLGGTSTSTVGNEGARDVAVDAQGAVYIVGDAISADFPTKNPAQAVRQGFINAFITKLDANGQMVYSTFLGGSSFDSPTSIKVDETGAVYVGGATSSFDFPTVNPIYGRGNRSDAFVTKLAPSGSSIVYSTYLGGQDNENVTDLTIDADRKVIVLGSVDPALGVSADDFPTVDPIQAKHGGGSRDGFLSIIDPDGSRLLSSTYLGGDGFDWFQSIGLSTDKRKIYLSAFADSSNFPPTTPSSFSVRALAATGQSRHLVAILERVGNHTTITTWGTSEEIQASIERDNRLSDELEPAKGLVFVESLIQAFPSISDKSGFPSVNGIQTGPAGGLDVRLRVLDSTLKTAKTLFFGGSGEDTQSGLATDTQGGTYIIGRTRSPNLPTVNPIQANHSGGNAFDGFLAVFHPETFETVFATYLGGIGMESLTGVTVDPQGNIYVVGETFGSFPNPTTGAIQGQLRGRTDAFIIKISPAIAAVPPPTSTMPFTFSDRGGVSASTLGNSASTSVGYGRIQPDPGRSAPSGLAIFGFRAGGVLVSEAAVPASALLQSGRIYAEVNGPVNTGLAIANPNNQAATITFNFTDTAGQTFGSGTTTIPANNQIAAFLDQAPFNGGSLVNGTFSFSSDVPIAVVALRGFTNERSEFLITTLPVSDLSVPAPVEETIMFPHFAEGGGWTTQVVLVNPTDSPLSGNVQLFTPAGAAATLTIDGQSGNTFPYSIAARSSRRFQSSGIGATQVGSLRIIPSAGNRTPSGVVIFTFKAGAVTVSEAGVPAVRTGNAFRLYAEASGNFDASQIGSIETGIAIANSSPSAATVTFELIRLDGASTGLTGSIAVPGNGQTALFMNQISGFSSMGNPATPFQGVLRISSSTAAIAVVGLRGRHNERHDFLITTTAPVDESSSPPATELFFPHLADSGGYTTQFVLFSGSAGQSSAGTLRLWSKDGQPFSLSLR